MEEIRGGKIEVLTFKDGVLARAAHDLLLELPDFRVLTDGERLEIELGLTSLRVVGALRDGRLVPDSLSERDKAEILVNVREKVLHTDRYPRGKLTARVERGQSTHRVDGSLELAGKVADLAFVVREEAGRHRGEVELEPSRWGIAPFKALLGAIKLQDRVVVRFDFPIAR